MKMILIIAVFVLLTTVRAKAQPPVTTLTNSIPPTGTAVRTNSAVTMFYDSLAPYGQWLWVAPYGWVWSPNGVSVDWRLTFSRQLELGHEK